MLVVSIKPDLYAQNWNLKIIDVDTTSFPSIKVNFTVYGDKALMIKDLSVQNVIPHDGEKKIDNFKLNIIDWPEKLRLCVLLDVSGSMRGEKFESAKNSFNELLNVLSSDDKCALITFGSEVTSISGFTNDFDFLRRSLDGIKLSMKTRLFDGLLEASKLFSAFEKTRNAIILITDGKDEGSIQELNSALDRAKRNDVEIFSIGIGRDADLSILAKISEETNAGYHGQINPQELRFVLTNIYDLLTKSYELTFTTADSIVQIASTKRKFGIRVNYDNLTKAEEIEYVVPRYELPQKDYSLYMIILALILLFLITIVFIIFNNRRKRENFALGISTEHLEEEESPDGFIESIDDDDIDQTDDDWENEFRKNIEEHKTVVISRGKFKTVDSLGYLVLRSRKFGMHIYELRQSELIIGRSSEADILLDDNEVSKLHAKVKLVEGNFIVDDMGSSNGTFVNSQETYHTELKDGDVIKIGDHELIFKCITEQK